jgi:hypothetical protein
VVSELTHAAVEYVHRHPTRYNINSVLELLHLVVMGDIAGLSEVYTASVFRVEVNSELPHVNLISVYYKERVYTSLNYFILILSAE